MAVILQGNVVVSLWGSERRRPTNHDRVRLVLRESIYISGNIRGRGAMMRYNLGDRVCGDLETSNQYQREGTMIGECYRMVVGRRVAVGTS